MTPRHHPTEEIMLCHVTGALPFAMDVVVASHLALCGRCQESAAYFAAVGGELLEELDDAPLAAGGLDAVLARLTEPAPEVDMPASHFDDLETVRLLPAPLRCLIDRPVAELPWRTLFPGVKGVPLRNAEENRIRLRLLRGEPGVVFPQHAHPGVELTLVLAGGISDESGHLLRGDLSVVEPGTKHRPIMDDDEECYCLVAMERRVVMTGLISRIQQLLGGY